MAVIKRVKEGMKKTGDRISRARLSTHIKELSKNKDRWDTEKHAEKVLAISKKVGLGEHVNEILKKINSKEFSPRTREKLAEAIKIHSTNQNFAPGQVDKMIKAMEAGFTTTTVKSYLAEAVYNHTKEKKLTKKQVTRIEKQLSQEFLDTRCQHVVRDVGRIKHFLGKAALRGPGKNVK